MARKKKYSQSYAEGADMDSTFAFIAGYTSAGFPYGTTWVDLGINPMLPLDEKKRLYEEGDYTVQQICCHLTPMQEKRLDRLYDLLDQIQEDIEDLANETGNDNIRDASLSVLDAAFSLSMAQADQMPNTEQPSADSPAVKSPDKSVEFYEDELPF